MDVESQTSSSGTIGKRRRKYPVYTRGKYKGQRKFPYGYNSKKYREYITKMFPRGTTQSKEFWGPTWQEANEVQRLRRGVGRFKGEGGFWKDVGKWGARLGGAAIGAITGGPKGAVEGYRKGAAISKFVGLGDYGVSTNQIVGGMGTNNQQAISVNNDSLTGDIILAQTEYMGNISINILGAGEGVSPFTVEGYDLNPGLKTFPFLSQIAQNFELYDWQGLMIQYKPTSGEFGSSSVSNTLGKVIMATRYGVNQDEQFRNAIEMQNYDYANSSKPSAGMIHGIETDNNQQLSEMMLVRNGVVDGKAPRILYDIGRLYVATEGIPYKVTAPTTIVLGELWVTYRVRLSRAKLYNTLGETAVWGKLSFTSVAGALFNGDLSTIGSVHLKLENVSATRIKVTLPDDFSYGKFSVIMYVGRLGTGSENYTAITVGADSTIFDVVTVTAGTYASTNNVMVATATLTLNNPMRKKDSAYFYVNTSAGIASQPLQHRVVVTQIDPDFSLL